MNLNFLKYLLQSDIKSLVKILLFFITTILLITPGALILFFEGNANLLSIGTFPLIVFSAIISIPFHFLGALIYLHPYKTFEMLIKLPIRDRIFNITLGTFMWSIFSVIAIYFFVHLIGGPKILPSYISGLKERYVIVYGMLLQLFGVLVIVNSYRISRFMKKTEK